MEIWESVNEIQAKRLSGVPVCAVLKDGSFYFGTVKSVKNGTLILEGMPGSGKMPTDPSLAKAHIQGLGGLGPMLFGGRSLFGGAAQGAQGSGLLGMGGQAGGGGSLFGGGGWGSGLKIGFGMLSYLMPLFGKFFF